MSDDEHSDAEASGDEQPSEAELALKKRREATRQISSGLNDEAKELLETNRQDRERMEEEILELRKRNEKRKKEREIEEKRQAAERAAEEERRKAADEAKRKQKEEEEAKKKRDRDSKKAEFDKLQNASKPNFVISKRSGSSTEEEPQDASTGKKSREQLEKEKRAILKQRIVELKADGLDQSGLVEKAKELHKLIHRLESEKYDLEKRFKLQQVEMMELAERARQANRVGKDGVKRVVIGDGESDSIQERFAGAPAKIEMYSKYERQKDKRTYPERKTVFIGPQYILPPEKIKPTRIVKWAEGGLPVYEEIEGAGEGEGHGH
jgi:hypothetical protein